MHQLYCFVNYHFCVHIIFYSLRFLLCIYCGVCIDFCMRKISIKTAKTTGSFKKIHYVNLVHQAYINVWASQLQFFYHSIPNVVSCTCFWVPRLKNISTCHMKPVLLEFALKDLEQLYQNLCLSFSGTIRIICIYTLRQIFSHKKYFQSIFLTISFCIFGKLCQKCSAFNTFYVSSNVYLYSHMHAHTVLCTFYSFTVKHTSALNGNWTERCAHINW